MNTKVEELKTAVQRLSGHDFAEFRKWAEEYFAQLWDEEIERDILAGKLDALMEEALSEERDGETSTMDNFFAARYRRRDLLYL